MSDKLNIGHGNFTCDNPLVNYSGSHDLEIMGSAPLLDLALSGQHRAARRASSTAGRPIARPASTSRSAPTPIRAT